MRIYFQDRAVTYSEFLNDVARKVAALVGKNLSEQAPPEMVTTEEAARILHITPDRLRHIKDRFPHVKSGGAKQGKLLFKRDALLENYSRL